VFPCRLTRAAIGVKSSKDQGTINPEQGNTTFGSKIKLKVHFALYLLTHMLSLAHASFSLIEIYTILAFAVAGALHVG
jgi:hypothetical protein